MLRGMTTGRVVRWVGAGWAVAVAAAFAACSSGSSLPPSVGSCTPVNGSSCSTGYGGGGNASSSGSGGEDGSTAQDSAASGTCGTAGALLNTLNNQCLPCVATGCCQAEAACTGQCLSLVGCTGGINLCETQYPAGITAYDDFAACLTMSCPTQCPTLPLATAGDF